jgi:hypothetical protein
MNYSDSMSTDEFLDFLFSKVAPIKHDIDLHDDDSCCDHIELERIYQQEEEELFQQYQQLILQF